MLHRAGQGEYVQQRHCAICPCLLTPGPSIMPVKRKGGSSRGNSPMLPTAAPNELKFGASEGFHRELRRRVDRYFQSTGRRQRDCPQMYLKTATLFGWFAASYGMLVFVVRTWW